MSNHIPGPQPVALSEEELMAVMRHSVYPGAADASIKMVIAYCNHEQLNPLLKPVHIVPMWSKVQKRMVDVILPGIGLYRTAAVRTKAYAGCNEPEFGPDETRTFKGTDKEGNDISATVTYPTWCRVTVRRIVAGHIAEFTATEKWVENFAAVGKTIVPNTMWQKRPSGQLAKCAEAQALRKGFPEIGAEPTVDEMLGKTLELDQETGEIHRPAIQPPQRKSEFANKGCVIDATTEPSEPAGETSETGGAAGSMAAPAEPAADQPAAAPREVTQTERKPPPTSAPAKPTTSSTVELASDGLVKMIVAWAKEKGAPGAAMLEEAGDPTTMPKPVAGALLMALKGL